MKLYARRDNSVFEACFTCRGSAPCALPCEGHPTVECCVVEVFSDNNGPEELTGFLEILQLQVFLDVLYFVDTRYLMDL